MPTPPLPPEAIELLRRPNPAVIATLRPDGAPVSTPIFYLWENGRVLITMEDGRVRLRHLRRDPRVTLSVLNKESWYTHIGLIGRVVEMYEDEGLADVDRISEHYLGKPYPARDHARVSGWIEIDRWFGWSGHAPAFQAT
jgi:PPOX class probable F420-dependent enzyme